MEHSRKFPPHRRCIRSSLQLLLIGLLLLLPALLLPVPSAAALGERVVEARLPNGLKVILLENHRAPMATFQVWYRAGSRNEQWGKSGLSHILEHMMFKGTKAIGPAELIREITVNGGEYNAFTSQDFAGYFETLHADRLDVPLRLESDRMRHLVLREEDFQTERMVVMEERRTRVDDSPQAFLLEQVQATAYQTQPYHWPVIGWMDDLARIGLEDVKNYYRSYYSPTNAFLVVVGDFKSEELLGRIRRAFAPLPRGVEHPQVGYEDPPQTGERRVVVERTAQLPFLACAYHVPNLRERDSYVLEVIAALLGDGRSSRLHASLVREKRLAVEVAAQHTLLSQDPGLFHILAAAFPGREPAELEGAIEEELRRLREEPVSERELERAKNQLEAGFIVGQDSLFMQAMLLAQHEIAKEWRAIDDYVPFIRAVTAEDVRRVAALYLVPRNRTMGILKPLPGADEQAGPRESAPDSAVREEPPVGGQFDQKSGGMP